MVEQGQVKPDSEIIGSSLVSRCEVRARHLTPGNYYGKYENDNSLLTRNNIMKEEGGGHTPGRRDTIPVRDLAKLRV